MTLPLRLSALAAALLLASCSVQRVDESAQRAENDAAMASQYAALLRNQQQQPKRETVVFSDKPWVSTQPVVAKRGMPSALDCELSYRPSGSVGITEIAQYITSQCGIAVLVSPDALNPNAGTAGTQPVSTGPAPIGNPSPDSLVGLLPAGVITNPATMSAAASSAGSSYRAADFTSLGGGSQVSGLKYSGKASGLLDEVTARLQECGGTALAIEDPPETNLNGLHGQGRCIQMQVSRRTGGYEEALLRALRTGADMILIGEIRDTAAAVQAVRAAINGVFVVCTFHAGSPTQALDRVLALASNEIKNAREILAQGLVAVVAQTLETQKDRRILKVRSLLLTEADGPAIREKIRKNEISSLDQDIENQSTRSLWA